MRVVVNSFLWFSLGHRVKLRLGYKLGCMEASLRGKLGCEEVKVVVRGCVCGVVWS